MNLTIFSRVVNKSLYERHLRGGYVLWCLLAAPSLAMAEQAGDFTYTVSGSTATITGYTGAGGAVTIPAMLNSSPVVAIGDDAFYRMASLTSVMISNGVTSIGNEAFFYCTSLTSVTIPSSVTSIGYGAFSSCSGLMSVTLPDSVTSLGVGAFKDCSGLTSLALSNGLPSIEDSVFGDCSGLTSVTIPNSVTRIADYAFAYCGNLTSVTISNSVTEIGSSTFFSCNSLMMVLIPRSVTSIGDGAFYFCDNLSRVDFTGDAPTLGTNVFSAQAFGLKLYRSKSASGFSGLPWTGFDMGFNDPPSPWVTKEIGSGKRVGYSIYKTGTYTQAGSGAFGTTTDKLRFSYQILSGDGEITAKVKAFENTGSSSRVGVMIRDTLAMGSRQVFIGLSGTGTYRWVRRTTKGGQNVTQNSSTGSVPEIWLRLVRKGSKINAYKSTDGAKWGLVGSKTVTLAKSCYIGLAVASGSTSTLNTSRFSNVKVTP